MSGGGLNTAVGERPVSTGSAREVVHGDGLEQLAASLQRVEAKFDEQTALLRAILAELQGWRERERRPATVSRGDREVLQRLLPAIAGSVGSELFVTAELFEGDSPALRVALRDLNPKQVGRLLRRAVGTPIAGLVVERVSSEAGAVVWQLSEFVSNEKVFVPHGRRSKSVK